MRDLVQIHGLIKQDDEASISNRPHKSRKELQVIVPIIVVDHYSNRSERITSFRFRRILTAKPTERCRLLAFVLLNSTVPVRCDDLSDIKTVDEALHVVNCFYDSSLNCLWELHIRRRYASVSHHIRLYARYPLLKYCRHCRTVGAGLR